MIVQTCRLLTSLLLAMAVLVAGAAPVGCDDEGSGTTGRRIALDVEIAASPESRRFTNARGWDITIDKALVATGALYLYDGEPLFAAARPRSRGFIRSAHAHPGHYVPGNAKGEMRAASSADLLSGAKLGAGNGVTGPVRSATFAFASPAAGPAAMELGQNVIVVEGTAAKGAETRAFRATVRADEVKNDDGTMDVVGCPFTPADMQGDGVVSIAVKLPVWFEQVAFDDVPASAGGEPVSLGDGLAHNQLVRGTKVGLAYAFSYAPR